MYWLVKRSRFNSAKRFLCNCCNKAFLCDTARAERSYPLALVCTYLGIFVLHGLSVLILNYTEDRENEETLILEFRCFC